MINIYVIYPLLVYVATLLHLTTYYVETKSTLKKMFGLVKAHPVELVESFRTSCYN